MSILLIKDESPSLPSGLQALYIFDEAAGQTLRDRSGRGRDITLGSTGDADDNDPSWVTEGLRFSSDDYVDASAFSELRPEKWTICAVIKPTLGATVPLIGWGSTSFPCVYAAAPFNSNRPLIWLANGCFRYFESAGTSNLQDNDWHFLAFRCSGNTIAAIEQSSLVVDGHLHAVHSTVTTEEGSTKNTVRVGAAGSNYFAQSDLAFLALHDRVLMDQEVTQMHDYAKLMVASRVSLP